MTDEAQVHAMIAAACLGTTSEADFTRDLRAFLEARGVHARDVTRIRRPPSPRALPATRAEQPDGGDREDARANARPPEPISAARRRCLRVVPRLGGAAHALPARRARRVPRVGEPHWRANPRPTGVGCRSRAARLVEFQLGAARARAGGRRPLPRSRSIARSSSPGRSADDITPYADSRAPAGRIRPHRARAAPDALLAYRDAENAVGFLELTPSLPPSSRACSTASRSGRASPPRAPTWGRRRARGSWPMSPSCWQTSESAGLCWVLEREAPESAGSVVEQGRLDHGPERS